MTTTTMTDAELVEQLIATLDIVEASMTQTIDMFTECGTLSDGAVIHLGNVARGCRSMVTAYRMARG